MELGGVEVPDLPHGWTPLEAIVLVKALDEEGVVQYRTRYSNGLLLAECMGMIHAETLVLDEEFRQTLQDDYGD